MERSFRNTKLHEAIFLGKLTVAQLFMKPPIFYGTQRSIMVFAKNPKRRFIKGKYHLPEMGI